MKYMCLLYATEVGAAGEAPGSPEFERVASEYGRYGPGRDPGRLLAAGPPELGYDGARSGRRDTAQ